MIIIKRLLLLLSSMALGIFYSLLALRINILIDPVIILITGLIVQIVILFIGIKIKIIYFKTIGNILLNTAYLSVSLLIYLISNIYCMAVLYSIIMRGFH